MISQIKVLANRVLQEKETIIKAIENFLRIAGIALLAIAALIIFMHMGVPVPVPA